MRPFSLLASGLLVVAGLLLMAPVVSAATLPEVTVQLAPTVAYASQDSALVLTTADPSAWQGRLRIRQGSTESGSLFDGGQWTTGYVTLDHFLHNGRLILPFHFSSSIGPGSAEVYLALRPIGSTTKAGEVALGSVTVADSAAASDQTVSASQLAGADEHSLIVWRSNGAALLVPLAGPAAAAFKVPSGQGQLVVWKDGQESALAAPPTPLGRGDVNQDGRFNVQDSILIKQLAEGDEPELSPEQALLADVNQDGLVTAMDASLVLSLAAEKLTPTNLPHAPLAVHLHALYPAPPSGVSEWIELCSSNAEPGMIVGLTVTDTVGEAHIFDLTGILADAKSCFQLDSKTTALSLSNSGDEVLLQRGNTVLERSGNYGKAATGATWLNDSGWHWLAAVTQANTSAGDAPTQAAKTVATAETADPETLGPVTETTPHDAERLVGNAIELDGEVSALTGTGFWLADELGKVRVYLPPEVRSSIAASRGQRWRVRGRMEVYRGSPRLSVLSVLDLLYLGEADKKVTTKTAASIKAKTTAKKVATTAAKLTGGLIGQAKAASAPEASELASSSGSSKRHQVETVTLTAGVLLGLLWLFLYQDKLSP